MAAKVFEMMNCFAVLEPLIKTFIQGPLLMGPLSLVGVVLLIRKNEKDDQNVYVGSNEKRKLSQL